MKLSIYFDGGVLYGNPGLGYGSFEIEGDIKFRAEKINLGNNITSNEAEYLSLIESINWLINNIDRNRLKEIKLSIWTDSKLLEGQISGKWKCKHPNMKPLLRQTLRLLSLFNKNFTIKWNGRDNNLARFGH